MGEKCWGWRIYHEVLGYTHLYWILQCETNTNCTVVSLIQGNLANIYRVIVVVSQCVTLQETHVLL